MSSPLVWLGPFPWGEAMAFGFGILRHSPATFWSMTPREMERAMSVFRPAAGVAPGRDDLVALMNEFPDGG